jgi:hypothetical protein
MKFIKKLIAKHNAKREEEIQDIMNDWENEGAFE